jgi:hypothetical protein
MQIPWQDITYLSHGNERQRRAYRTLERLRVLDILRDYTPVLVGTLPIAIDVAESDLDIVCEVHDLDAFEALVRGAFGCWEGFRLKRKQINDLPVLVANLNAGMPVEIFGQPRPVVEQNAYRHMVVEARLLAIGGETARQEIQRLKRAGLKTEPAFAHYFDIPGDPFEALLALSALDEKALRATIESEGAKERFLS